MTKKLSIVGPFADVNLGDYAMLINNLVLAAPSDLIIFTYDHGFSSQLINDYYKESNVDICFVEIDERKAAKLDANSMPHDIIAALANSDEVLARLRAMGRLLVNGGGYFNSLWFKPHRRVRLCQILAPILLASAHGIPVVFSGNGYGPFENEDIPFFERIFSFLRNAVFGSRDALLSKVWGGKVGIPLQQMSFIPDDLFPVTTELLEEPLAFERPKSKYCVLETYYSEDYLLENKTKFLELFQYVQDELKLKLVLLPFHLGHGGLTQSHLLQSWDSRIEVIDIAQRGYLPISDAMSLISNAEFMISSRYHALVFAVQAKTPIFSVMRDVLDSKAYYFNKNYGFLETALGRNFDPNVFLFDCFTTVIDEIQESLTETLNNQKRLFDEHLGEGVKVATERRKQFFNNEVFKQ